MPSPATRKAPTPSVSTLPLLLHDPVRFCLRAATQGPGIVRLNTGFMQVYIVSDPEYVRHVLVTNAGNYGKGSIMDGIRLALGNGLFTSDGDAWRRQRRLMQPAFHGRQIENMAATVTELTETMTRQWATRVDRGEPIDILAESTKLNIQIILRVLFGAEVNQDNAARLLRLTDAVFAGMARRVWTFFLPPWVPTPGAAAYRAAIVALEQEIYGIIRTRRATGPGERPDLLDVLLDVVDDQGDPMTDKQLRDEIFTIFLAGYESTASGITWCWHLLTQHPHVAETLRVELDETLRGDSPRFEDLTRLPYLRRVLDETFRLYPSFPMFFRSSTTADTIGPYGIPAKAQLVISPYATHHDPRYWHDPEAFDPDRFSPERFTTAARNAYYPFGKGQRICIGEQLSLLIAQLTIATLAQRYDSRPTPGTGVKPRYAMTYQPKHGLPVILTPR